MPSVSVSAFQMSRRDSLRLAGMGAVATIGSAMLGANELLALDACEAIDIRVSDSIQTKNLAGTLQYWIDGMHLGARSDLKSRANLAVFMNLKQTADTYVESVVLLDAQKRVLGARYFDSSARMIAGQAPYVIFENIELDPTKTYQVVYRQIAGNQVNLYSATIDKPEITRINTVFLPDEIKNDFKTFLAGNQANPTPGLITSQFQFYTLNGLSAHTARGRVSSINSGGGFSINIDFMHGDAAPSHYMRYFLVLDPVGRVLGVQKRAFGAPTSNGGAGFTWNVGQITNDQIAYYNLQPDQIPNILDCPYVQIYTEDSYDAMARGTVRLR